MPCLTRPARSPVNFAKNSQPFIFNLAQINVKHFPINRLFKKLLKFNILNRLLDNATFFR